MTGKKDRRTPPGVAAIRRISTQWGELFNQRFLTGGVSEEHLRWCLQRAMDPDPFWTINARLLTLDEQLIELDRYNRLYWGGRISAEAFQETKKQIGFLRDNASPIQQRVSHLHHLHAHGDTVGETIGMWWDVARGELGDRAFDRYGLVADLAQAAKDKDGSGYHARPVLHRAWPDGPAGISYRQLDMVANYPPNGKDTSVAEVRREGKRTLAQAEAMSALILHKALLFGQLRTEFPRIVIPGIEVSRPGNTNWDKVISLAAYGPKVQVNPGFDSEPIYSDVIPEVIR